MQINSRLCKQSARSGHWSQRKQAADNFRQESTCLTFWNCFRNVKGKREEKIKQPGKHLCQTEKSGCQIEFIDFEWKTLHIAPSTSHLNDVTFVLGETMFQYKLHWNLKTCKLKVVTQVAKLCRSHKWWLSLLCNICLIAHNNGPVVSLPKPYCINNLMLDIW